MATVLFFAIVCFFGQTSSADELFELHLTNQWCQGGGLTAVQGSNEILDSLQACADLCASQAECLYYGVRGDLWCEVWGCSSPDNCCTGTGVSSAGGHTVYKKNLAYVTGPFEVYAENQFCQGGGAQILAGNAIYTSAQVCADLCETTDGCKFFGVRGDFWCEVFGCSSDVDCCTGGGLVTAGGHKVYKNIKQPEVSGGYIPESTTTELNPDIANTNAPLWPFPPKIDTKSMDSPGVQHTTDGYQGFDSTWGRMEYSLTLENGDKVYHTWPSNDDGSWDQQATQIRFTTVGEQFNPHSLGLYATKADMDSNSNNLVGGSTTGVTMTLVTPTKTVIKDPSTGRMSNIGLAGYQNWEYWTNIYVPQNRILREVNPGNGDWQDVFYMMDSISSHPATMTIDFGKSVSLGFMRFPDTMYVTKGSTSRFKMEYTTDGTNWNPLTAHVTDGTGTLNHDSHSTQRDPAKTLEVTGLEHSDANSPTGIINQFWEFVEKIPESSSGGGGTSSKGSKLGHIFDGDEATYWSSRNTGINWAKGPPTDFADWLIYEFQQETAVYYVNLKQSDEANEQIGEIAFYVWDDSENKYVEKAHEIVARNGEYQTISFSSAIVVPKYLWLRMFKATAEAGNGLKVYDLSFGGRPTDPCSICHANADCNNDVCTCKDGYFGNGETCEPCSKYADEDASLATCTACTTSECTTSTCAGGYDIKGDSCTAKTCITARPEFGSPLNGVYDTPVQVVCNEGFEATQATIGCDETGEFLNYQDLCINIDECTTNTHDCATDAVCKDVSGSHHCVCSGNTAGDGKTTCLECPIGSVPGKNNLECREFTQTFSEIESLQTDLALEQAKVTKLESELNALRGEINTLKGGQPDMTLYVKAEDISTQCLE